MKTGTVTNEVSAGTSRTGKYLSASVPALLKIFFSVAHDPTTLNRQGADVGPQYRSVIFYHNAEQKAAAESMIARLDADKTWDDPLVTQVVPFEAFFPAEDYHQEYFQRNYAPKMKG